MFARRMLVVGLGLFAVALSAVSLAWACVPSGGLSITPTSGPAGTQVMANATGFPPGEAVEIRWESMTGTVLETGTGPTVQKPITIPADAAAGPHVVIAAVADPTHAQHSSENARALFTVPGGAPSPGPGSGSPPPSGSGQTIATGIPESPFAPLAPKGNVITGTSGNDKLKGTSGADVINCLAGNDVVNGGGGNDVINCGAGKDRVNGGAGNDKLSGGPGNDKLSGGPGKDKLMGGAGDDSLKGGAGKDKLMGGAGNDMLFRGLGDILAGGSGKNRMIG